MANHKPNCAVYDPISGPCDCNPSEQAEAQGKPAVTVDTPLPAPIYLGGDARYGYTADMVRAHTARAVAEALAPLKRENLELKRVYEERGNQIQRLDVALERAIQPSQPAGAVQQTDLSKELRITASARFGAYDNKMLLAAAEEIERYYTGMLAWKKTAEAVQEPSYWLVESVHGAGWWDGRTLSRGIDPRHFTNDPNLAVRFAREADANLVIDKSSSLIATEHIWIDTAPPAAVQPKED